MGREDHNEEPAISVRYQIVPALLGVLLLLGFSASPTLASQCLADIGKSV